jgi:NTE family protein
VSGAWPLVLLLLATTNLTGCIGYRSVNEPLETYDIRYGYRPSHDAIFRSPGHVAMYVAFSGGGTRAAALAYGVLEALRDTEVVVDGERIRLIDEIDTVSGVSGGSFPAAYYGLFGDRIFQEFEPRFLRRNIEGAIIWRVFWPWNTIALLTPWMSRSDIAKGIYDGSVYDKATFATLQAAHGPRVFVNATDLASGERFVFSQSYFDAICSDLSKMPIAYAVAASSAVPALLSPVTLKSYAGTCGFALPPPMRSALDERESAPRRYRAVMGYAQFSDPQKRYVHLVDGGIADNLGLRAGLDTISAAGGLYEAAELRALTLPKHMIVISVNAETSPPRKLDVSSAAPGLAAMMGAVSGAQIRRYNFETLLLTRESLRNWVTEARGAGFEISGYMVEVGLDNTPDPVQRAYLMGLPTSFTLSDEEVDALREAGRKLLAASPDFQRFLADLAAE